ncbi:RNA polymerase sigma factor [Blastomonas fulva]|uniref:RNA polymerase sigma factor n=1 Tax=Blastomonas fulva TaxID=1550728 RepID=UPI003F726A51
MTRTSSFASFDDFYRSQHRGLFNYFRRRVGREEAPDLVQQAFCGMFRCGAFDRVDNPKAYLFRIASNLVIDEARREMRRPRLVFSFNEELDAPAHPEQEQQIEAIELRRVFWQALRAMPRRTRRVYLMHRLRGMTYRQIAEQLDIGENGVEYHMMRALARCRLAAAAHFSGQAFD